MELSDFVATINHRIPTPGEFVSFAKAQAWRFDVTGEKPMLLVKDGSDPMARAFAKMLSREPYRTRVLEFLTAAAPVRQLVAVGARESETAGADDSEGERVRPWR